MFVFSFGVLSATRTEHRHSRTRFSDSAFDWSIGLRSYKSSLRQSPLRGHDWSTLRPLEHRPRIPDQSRPTQRSTLAFTGKLRIRTPRRVYEVRPRSDQRGFDLISYVLPFGRLWYAEPNAVERRRLSI